MYNVVLSNMVLCLTLWWSTSPWWQLMGLLSRSPIILFNSEQFTLRLSASRWNLLAPYLQISYNDLTNMIEYQFSDIWPPRVRMKQRATVLQKYIISESAINTLVSILQVEVLDDKTLKGCLYCNFVWWVITHSAGGASIRGNMKKNMILTLRQTVFEHLLEQGWILVWFCWYYIRHVYTQEFYWSYSFFISKCLRTDKFCDVCSQRCFY